MSRESLIVPNRAHYIAGPDSDHSTAQASAAEQGLGEAILLRRRGTTLGWIAAAPAVQIKDHNSALSSRWNSARPYVLPGHCTATIANYLNEIEQAQQLMARIAEGENPADLLEQPHYSERLQPRFEMLAASSDEGDQQEIETIEFDVMDGDEIIAENLWCKCSWLSYEDDDSSLRFRFSFGMVGYEDVAADLERQLYAGELTEAIFPESAIISSDKKLEQQLCSMLGISKLAYVERIIYFNAPNGGAHFHQDAERGHLGVVFAQLRGRTSWSACSKNDLLDEIQTFVGNHQNHATLQQLLSDTAAFKELTTIVNDREQLSSWLDDSDNAPLDLLLNRCPQFYQQLSDHGHTYILTPGDIILLPQKSSNECCWHTVFCLDDFAGEALSFAMREVA